MNMPKKIRDFGWFGAGWAVFKGGTKDPDYYPPLNDPSVSPILTQRASSTARKSYWRS